MTDAMDMSRPSIWRHQPLDRNENTTVMGEQTVYKYPLVLDDEQTVSMPAAAKILHVDMQAGTLCMWALVDVRQPLMERLIIVRGTGHPVPDVACHLGSVMDGPFVWHVFDGGWVRYD